MIAGFALFQAILWYRDWSAFFGPDAWVQWEISRSLGLEWQLHMLHVAGFLKHFGFSPDQSVTIFYWAYVTFLVALLVGWHTRVAAFLVCLGHYVMMNTISIFVYGMDIFLQIALFYLVVMPVAKAYSLDVWQGRVSSAPSWGVTLSRRVLQIHLCLAYMSSGFEKLSSPAWWSGNVIWRSLVQPDFRQYDFTWLARFPWLAMLSSWFVMLIETGYCVAMWVPRLRVFWMVGIIVLHLGIAVFMGLGLFGLIMILLTISAFGYEAWTDVEGTTRPASVRFHPTARA
ncbi:MAG: hypothetical protein ABR611_00405 [Chthoniobacterales bacterium]